MAADGSWPLNSAPPAPPRIDEGRCGGCGRCVAACPVRIIALEVAGFRKLAMITHPDRCGLCHRCIAECPIEAVSF